MSHIHSLRLLLLVPLLLLSGCGQERAVATPAQLQARLAATSTINRTLYQQVVARMLKRLDADVAAGRQPRIDVLALSGGAEWGAFGAGFLHAWSQIPASDPRAMPQFDLVTGISTGALIAPYALIGDTQTLSRIDDLYRTSRPAFAKKQLWGFLGSQSGFYDISELEAAIRADLDATVVPGLRTLVGSNRAVLVASADLDLGVLRLWDVEQEAATSVDRLYAVERSAIAIPAAFDPVALDDSLYADAGVLMQFIALADPQVLASTLQRWNTAHPQTPAQLRQWIIVNNKPHEPLVTVQPKWTECLPRGMNLTIKSGIIGPITTMTLQAQLLRSQGIDVELRWISIPPDLPIDPALPPFDSRITVPLSDLGRRLGASQDGWQTKPPRFTEREWNDPSPAP